MANKNAFEGQKPVPKPEIVRQQNWGSGPTHVGTQMKESILSGVDALRVDKGGKSGGV